MKTLERCPHPHAFPAIECTGVRLTRGRRAPVCMCGHPKTVHQHYRPGRDCSKCGCDYYETARRRRGTAVAVWAVIIGVPAAFWAAVWFGIGSPILDAIRHR